MAERAISYPAAYAASWPADVGRHGAAVPLGIAGDPVLLKINSDGWTASVVFLEFGSEDDTDAYSFTPDSTPKVVFTVTSAGFDASGNPTTVERTVFGTIWARDPWPNNLSPAEDTTTNGVRATIALSDFIYAGDSNITADFSAGVYTAAEIASNAKSGIPVTNLSEKAWPKPIGCFITENNLSIQSGEDFTVEAFVAHAYPQAGRQVAAVKYTISDGVNSVTSSAVASMTQSARITGGNPVPCYSHTFSAASISGLDDGPVTVDMVAYPFLGDNTLVAAEGADEVPIAATVKTSNLHPLLAYYDSAGDYAPVYAWVGSGGTATGAGAVQTSASDPGTGAGDNYASIGAAIAGIKAYNNASRGHDDTAGGVVYCRASASPYSGFGSSIAAQTNGPVWLTISAAPGEDNTTVIFQTGAQKALAAGGTKFVDIGLTASDNTAGNAIVLTGQDGSNTNPITTEVLFEGCAIATKRDNNAFLYLIGLRNFYNSSISEAAGRGYIATPFSVTRATFNMMGCELEGTASNSFSAWLTNYLGNTSIYASCRFVGNTSANYVQPTSIVNACNSWTKSLIPMINVASAAYAPENYAEIQNLGEKITANSQPAWWLLADGNVQPVNNIVRQYNTVVGERTNLLYNDTGSAAVYKFCNMRFNIDAARNCKRDTFATQNAARIGVWAFSHGVGHIGNVASACSDGTTAPSSTSWYGEYFGLTGSSTDDDVGYEQAISYTSNRSATGTDAGEGDYTLAADSPAYGRVPSGFAGLPFDLAGVTRANDGTGAAGAYEGGAPI